MITPDAAPLLVILAGVLLGTGASVALAAIAAAIPWRWRP